MASILVSHEVDTTSRLVGHDGSNKYEWAQVFVLASAATITQISINLGLNLNTPGNATIKLKLQVVESLQEH
jgi:hypothetical protein